jgi:alpha-galactosidase
MSTLFRLKGTTVGLLLDARAGGVPHCVHWGAPLGDGEGLAAAHALPVPPASLDTPVRASVFPEPGLGFSGQPALRGSRGRLAWAFRFQLQRADAGTHRVVFFLHEPQAELALELRFELDAETDVLQVSSVLTNTGSTPFQLDACAAASFTPGGFAREALVFDGAWSREFQPRRLPLSRGVLLRENRRGRTSHDSFPGLVVGEEGFGDHHGRVWGFHLGWSGNSRLLAEILPDGTRQVQLGELFEPGEVWLAPGERYVSPVAYATTAPDGLDGLRDRFHRFVRGRLLRHPARPRPVHFNTWEALYFGHEPAALEELVERAAAVGVERFVLDDGWFLGRQNDRAGLGDWSVDPGKYPRGLGPLISSVRARGMEFGLWVEPEMVNPDSELYRAHPDWVLHLDPLPRPTARHQLVLDLTRPEVAEHLFTTFDGLLAGHDIGYLKWDMNRDLAAAGSGGLAAARRQTLAVYALIDRLRAAHPDVDIESCSSGGGRADYAILSRTDRIWTSDSNDALERQHIQRGFGLFFPPEVMGAHVGPETCHITGRRLGLDLRAITALFGHLGLELDLRALGAPELARLKQHLATYRRFRALLHGGRAHQLPVADVNRLAHGVVSPERDEALFAVVQLGSPELGSAPLVRLRGLDPEAAYRVRVLGPLEEAVAGGLPEATRWLGEGRVLSGRTWMEAGVSIPLFRPETAVLLHCQREERPV